jgi:hypothetical protein
MSFDFAIFAMEYSSSVRQSSKRQSAGFNASNSAEASLGIISVGNVIIKVYCKTNHYG